MSDRLWVTIRLSLLQAHLSGEDAEPKSEQEIVQFLRAAGFRPLNTDLWAVREADLGHLRPDEVGGVRRAPPYDRRHSGG